MQHTLIAVFDNRADAQSAMTELLSVGFDRASVRMNEEESSSAGITAGGSTSRTSSDEGVSASIKNFFDDLLGDDSSAAHEQKYSSALERGHHALTVTATDEDQVERAAEVIERFNPIDIDEKTAEWGTATASTPAPTTGTVESNKAVATPERSAGTTAIPIVQEQLKVGKREVARGGVRVYSRIVETPVQENIILREEHVHVERRPVDQLLDVNNTTAFKEQTIELRERGEEAVVQKTARVVEEVVIGKDVTERQETVSDTVRHTEVEVEQLGAEAERDNATYKTHWSTNYGSTGKSYDDYAPAYAYGNEMAGKYRGREWNDVENNLRSDWDSRNSTSGASTWEQFKGAVRHGWNSMTK
jgi:uncharacterized protein (TIGR02271 family)